MAVFSYLDNDGIKSELENDNDIKELIAPFINNEYYDGCRFFKIHPYEYLSSSLWNNIDIADIDQVIAFIKDLIYETMGRNGTDDTTVMNNGIAAQNIKFFYLLAHAACMVKRDLIDNQQLKYKDKAVESRKGDNLISISLDPDACNISFDFRLKADNDLFLLSISKLYFNSLLRFNYAVTVSLLPGISEVDEVYFKATISSINKTMIQDLFDKC